MARFAGLGAPTLFTLLATLEAGCSSSPTKLDGQGAPDRGSTDRRSVDQGPVEAGASGCKVVPCVVSKTVSSAAALQAELEALPWTGLGVGTSVCVPVTSDLEISGGTITVDAKAIKSPTPSEVRFLASGLPAGVSCTAQNSYCQTVSFAPGRYRFRGEVQDWHPIVVGGVPVITVLPSCTEPCAAGQLLCEANHTCWAAFQAYCGHCLVKPALECLCLTAAGPAPDKTACPFMVSNHSCVGECQGGTCRYSGSDVVCLRGP